MVIIGFGGGWGMSLVAEETLNVVLVRLLLKRGLRSLRETRIHGLGAKSLFQ